MKKLKNKFEKDIDAQLRKAKVTFQYETEHIPYILARHYIPDFIIYTPRGKIYVECKGYLRPEHRAKMAAVKRQHPNLDIRILFYSSTPKNINWAKKIGFTYAIKRIPRSWLK